MLMYEVLLTRICALRLYFHFGFLIVSNCLLGIGASGSMISVFQNYFRKQERLWIWLFSVFFLVSLVLTYVFLLSFDIDPGINFQSFSDILNFLFFNLVAAVPFFFVGSAIGLILTFNARKVNKIYCTDLVGAGIGCLFSPLFLWKTGAGGCVIVLALLALVGAMVASPSRFRRVSIISGTIAGLIGVSILGLSFTSSF